MNLLEKLFSKSTLAVATATVVTATYVHAQSQGSGNNPCTGSGSCPSSAPIPCCLYYSNGNPFVQTCCTLKQKCQAYSVGGGVAVAPYVSGNIDVGASGCVK